VTQRKTVTVFFSDVVGSTSLGESLDPEVLRSVMGRYFEEAQTVLERHGGTLEKFIGDAVVALFGVPVAHEDDALRALRAADEIRERLEPVNDDLERAHGVRLEIRTGVNTGEVVVDESGTDGFRAAGDTMNTAARLEQVAGGGEILIGAVTRELGGDAIVVEPVDPLELKGKAAPVEAFRLVRVLPHASPYGRRDDAPLVGRRRELALLRGALDRAFAEERCELVTIVGAAGVGKSRLVRELLAPLDDAVQVLVGRCVSYGEGVTYLPLAEALEPVLGTDALVAASRLLAGDTHAAEQVAALFAPDGAAESTEDTMWAVRRLLEALARERPVVLVVDDVHWAEATFLDLLEYVGTFAGRAPIVILATSRPELLEARPTWSAPRDNATVVVLQPLSEIESAELAASLGTCLDEGSVHELVDAADGNPLFLEQLLALNAGFTLDLVVPPTIHALLAARIDQLGDAERRVLECASVEGRRFDGATIGALLPAELVNQARAQLLSLARKQFIRPDRTAEREEAFAFVHALMRDAAYLAIPKAARADLHLRFAALIEDTAPPEITGHHLAEAVQYRRELGEPGDTDAIAARAADMLAMAGRRASALGDDRAGVKLLERASATAPPGHADALWIRQDLAVALAYTARLEEAREMMLDVQRAALAAGDERLVEYVRLDLLAARTALDPTLTNEEVVREFEGACALFESQGDENGLASAHFMVHWGLFNAGRMAESIEQAELALGHATSAGNGRERLRAFGGLAMATLWGPTSAPEGLRRVEELVERADGARLVLAYADRVRGGLLSMTGDFDVARDACQRSAELYRELGHPVSAIGVAMERQRVERQAGDLAAAELLLRDAYTRFGEMGNVGYGAWVGTQLASVLVEQGAFGEALGVARAVGSALQSDHAFGQITLRLVEASALAAEERTPNALERAREALALVEQTDLLQLHGDVLVALADLDRDRSDEWLALALELFDLKGDVVSAARVRERL
jgi:class 3 adenylate cyclase/tetratricopeptide (TPR) repeat protein